MGYTHYWKLKKPVKKISPATLELIKEMLNKAYVGGIIQYEHDDRIGPKMNEEEIIFNGVGEDGHETFVFRTKVDKMNEGYEEGWTFDFCKTARKPYDEFVMRTLLLLKADYKEDLRLSSDGDFEEEWHDTIREMEEKYDLTFTIDKELGVY